MINSPSTLEILPTPCDAFAVIDLPAKGVIRELKVKTSPAPVQCLLLPSAPL